MSKLEHAIAYFVCDLYTSDEKLKTSDIAKRVYKEFGRKYSRESVHRFLQLAREQGMLRLHPPVDRSLQSKLRDRFGLPGDQIQVVNVYDNALRWSGEHVAIAGVDLVVDLIQEIWKTRPRDQAGNREPIRIGLGAGRATMDFSRELSLRVVSDDGLPPLELIAISAGCPATSPQYAPASFFSHFPADDNRVTFVGLFGETLVRQSDLAEISQRPGVREAFAKKDSIDIVVTAMGDATDEHDLLTTFLRQADVPVPDSWIGNVQYRPYTADGPYKEDSDALRALTVFDLNDFIEMAKTRNRHVVLLARQCGICGRSRAKALRPLMDPEMKVWSRCVMDLHTAKELCETE